MTQDTRTTPTRKRNEQIILRLTPAEKEKIANKKSVTKHRSYADFFMELLSKKQFVTVTCIEESLEELKRQGNNLNHLAKIANASGEITTEQNILETLRLHYRLYKNLETLANDVRYGTILPNLPKLEHGSV